MELLCRGLGAVPLHCQQHWSQLLPVTRLPETSRSNPPSTRLEFLIEKLSQNGPALS